MLSTRLVARLERIRQNPFTGFRNFSIRAPCMFTNVGIRPKALNTPFNSVVISRVFSYVNGRKANGSFHTFSFFNNKSPSSKKAKTSTPNTLHSDIAWQAMTTQKPFRIYQAENDKTYRFLYLLFLATTLNAAFFATLTGMDMYRSGEIGFQNWYTYTYSEKVMRIGSCLVIPLLYLATAFLLFLPRRTIHSLYALPARQIEMKTGLPGPNNRLYLEKSIILPRNEVFILSQSIDKNPMVMKVSGTRFYYLLDTNGNFAGGSKNILSCLIPTQKLQS
ncbi:mitochondrial membrane protein, TMEM186-like protein, implicated in respiratory complex assembly [Schizosaccharomyces osmophilus]|uniref:Mitochondrial membrane protein, TMEM186-like protein, implicated in respiratory complex assembly n=1 Tax=Schizosaccharomyces osmophilus TaxID=2545709 RepID=A0AAE9WAQ6_9SCHI|nr:mitochondrial membrane protein, TMEM186-like protein, implicated in respiratory complex assembly [Schizosaccharomyces osmophilus]WBW72430.1 mitochondrial membrane protein, TMEM186-like protein, implicated in respiratory complex assembly [Schizosaccharomyces osmophilus]